MFTKIKSQINHKTTVPLTPGSKRVMPKFYKTAVALKTWGLSGFAFGLTGFVLLCYITEWRTVLQYLPYYNGRYRELEIQDEIDRLKEQAENLLRTKNASGDFEPDKKDIKPSDIKK